MIGGKIMRHRYTIPIFALLMLSACQKEAKLQPISRAVRVFEVGTRANVHPNRNYSGTLEPYSRIDLTTRVSGTVRTIAEFDDGKVKRLIQEGDRVTKGQILATLDERDLQNQLAAATSNLMSAEAELKLTRTASQQAETEYKRSRELFASNALAQAELDRGESSWASAKARVEAARAQLKQKTELQSIARRAIEDSRLISPIDGLVARRNVNVGEAVTAGKPVFSLIDVSELRFTFSLPDTKIQAIRIGDQMPLRAEALSNHLIMGTVAKIFPVADPLLKTFTVEVSVPNPDNLLRAGMVASASLGSDALADKTVVPLSAIVRAPQGTGFAVYVVDIKEKRAKLRSIAVSDLSGNDVIVTDGIKDGDLIISQGAAFIHDNDNVEIAP
jgi:RND family efflux transporter MFP subunit